ncbi:MAG: M15 family metallopeptidase [Blautia sp.]|nr:M15 family metallopeptidase [Blautia sp.]
MKRLIGMMVAAALVLPVTVLGSEAELLDEAWMDYEQAEETQDWEEPEQAYEGQDWEGTGLDYMVLVNKLNPLPDGWEDTIETVSVANAEGYDVEVEAETYAAFMALKADLESEEGIILGVSSAYRSTEQQQEIMNSYVEEYGAEEAKMLAAEPGYSEHQTGLALDIYYILADGSEGDSEDAEASSPVWERIHARLADYGFILRYPEGKEYITGYAYEPWHIRYLDDIWAAEEIMADDITLEEYLGAEFAGDAVEEDGSKADAEDEADAVKAADAEDEADAARASDAEEADAVNAADAVDETDAVKAEDALEQVEP